MQVLFSIGQRQDEHAFAPLGPIGEFRDLAPHELLDGRLHVCQVRATRSARFLVLSPVFRLAVRAAVKRQAAFAALLVLEAGCAAVETFARSQRQVLLAEEKDGANGGH